jgi:hypothetical protein
MVFDRINAQDYLSKIKERLKQQDFVISDNIKYESQIFEYVAKRTKFEVERFGWITIFFVFSKNVTPDINSLKQFSTISFKYIRKTRGIYPPPGFFYSILCFPVAIVDTIDNNTIDFIHRTEPPKHWVGFEKLAVFCLETKWLHYCTFDFQWGALYYQRDREIMKEILTP